MSIEYQFKDERGKPLYPEEGRMWLIRALKSSPHPIKSTPEEALRLIKAPIPEKSFISEVSSPLRNLRAATKDLTNFKLWAYPDAKQKIKLSIVLNEEALAWAHAIGSRMKMEAFLSPLGKLMYSGQFLEQHAFKSNIALLEHVKEYGEAIQVFIEDGGLKKECSGALKQLLSTDVFHEFLKETRSGLCVSKEKSSAMAMSGFSLNGGYHWQGWVFEVLSEQKKLRPKIIKNTVLACACRNISSEASAKAWVGAYGEKEYAAALIEGSPELTRALLSHPDHAKWQKTHLPPLLSPVVWMFVGHLLNPWDEEAFLSKKGLSLVKTEGVIQGWLGWGGSGWIRPEFVIEEEPTGRYDKGGLGLDQQKLSSFLKERLSVAKECGYDWTVQEVRLIQRTLKAVKKSSEQRMSGVWESAMRAMNEVWLEHSLNQAWEEEGDLEESASQKPALTKKRL